MIRLVPSLYLLSICLSFLVFLNHVRVRIAELNNLILTNFTWRLNHDDDCARVIQRQQYDINSSFVARRRRRSAVGDVISTSSSETSSRRHRDSVISTLLRQEIERRRSLKDAADGPSAADQLLPGTSAAFELPGIHISRIETMDFDDDELSAGSR